MSLRFKKKGIYRSTGAGGGGERAEIRVEFELRRAIAFQSTSNRNVVQYPTKKNPKRNFFLLKATYPYIGKLCLAFDLNLGG
jgi:hypothetical protein